MRPGKGSNVASMWNNVSVHFQYVVRRSSSAAAVPDGRQQAACGRAQVGSTALEKYSGWRDHEVFVTRRRALSESDPIRFRPREAGGLHSSQALGTQSHQSSPGRSPAPVVAFNRLELDTILAVYARKVAAGEWRDYALEMGRERATFAIFRRASEYPLYRIEKCPKLARKQGAYSVIAAGGLILKRGHDLSRVLAALDGMKLVKR
jgi:hypothetical protein